VPADYDDLAAMTLEFCPDGMGGYSKK